MLIDNFNRQINYARIAVTDKCNLRCDYCMPLQGLDWLPKSEILSYEEILDLLIVLADLGISKVRFTGGEPFVRKDFIKLLEGTSKIKGIEKIAISTNGTEAYKYLDQLESLGVSSINLSIDSFDESVFNRITNRLLFNDVMKTFEGILDRPSIHLKVNTVVLHGVNDNEIASISKMSQHHRMDVRFIEEMPFNGIGQKKETISSNEIIARLKELHPEMVAIEQQHGATSQDYFIPGFKGKVGVIEAFSRTFCGSCNRIRITPKGDLKTCLYDNGQLSLRSALREKNFMEVERRIQNAVSKRYKDGFEAEKDRTAIKESMATIGG
ncbi:MAG: GTP 3',8-cyclase MoaA [Flavobacteriales bacterium]